MRRTCCVLLALVFTLAPAVWARRMAEYPGWAGEVALRAAGCTGISTRMSGWVVLPEATDAAGAAAVAERLSLALGAATLQASLRESRWLVTADLTVSTGAADRYDRLNRALAEVGYAGPTHVAVIGRIPGRRDAQSLALTLRTFESSMLADVVGTVADGVAGEVVSGIAAMLPRQAGSPTPGGSYALTLSFSETPQATIITVSVPGLR